MQHLFKMFILIFAFSLLSACALREELGIGQCTNCADTSYTKGKAPNPAANPYNACCYNNKSASCNYYRQYAKDSYYFQNYCVTGHYYRGCQINGCVRPAE